jgi:hypothetical protein
VRSGFDPDIFTPLAAVTRVVCPRTPQEQLQSPHAPHIHASQPNILLATSHL